MKKFFAIASLTIFAFAVWLGWAVYSQERLESHCDHLAASFGAHLSNGRRSESSKYLIWCGSPGPSDGDSATIRDTTTNIINAGFGQTEISLDLSGTSISNESITEIGRIRGLYYIDIRDTEITEQGAKELRSRMPGTIVRW